LDLFDLIFGIRKKRIFISFAIEDSRYRDYLVAQAKNQSSPFEFIDMSVKKAWQKDEWRKRCRTKIRRSDGVIVLLSNHTMQANGARWEIKCAIQEHKRIIGMRIKKNEQCLIPSELSGKKVIRWSWKNLENFINSIKI
jgi:hypothetical protein